MSSLEHCHPLNVRDSNAECSGECLIIINWSIVFTELPKIKCSRGRKLYRLPKNTFLNCVFYQQLTTVTLPKLSSANFLKVVLCIAKDSQRNKSLWYLDSSESFLQSDTVDEVVQVLNLF